MMSLLFGGGGIAQCTGHVMRIAALDCANIESWLIQRRANKSCLAVLMLTKGTELTFARAVVMQLSVLRCCLANTVLVDKQ